MIQVLMTIFCHFFHIKSKLEKKHIKIIILLIVKYTIYDINEMIITSFADDTKVWRGINHEANKLQLQHEMNQIYVVKYQQYGI